MESDADTPIAYTGFFSRMNGIDKVRLKQISDDKYRLPGNFSHTPRKKHSAKFISDISDAVRSDIGMGIGEIVGAPTSITRVEGNNWFLYNCTTGNGYPINTKWFSYEAVRDVVDLDTWNLLAIDYANRTLHSLIPNLRRTRQSQNSMNFRSDSEGKVKSYLAQNGGDRKDLIIHAPKNPGLARVVSDIISKGLRVPVQEIDLGAYAIYL
ncbi:hypothetical protein GOV05_03550 [Candidatus Woesearchaeota archaeon]|nr:hypothetical protein [Candidatus Woesearchaeota archaeon]